MQSLPIFTLLVAFTALFSLCAGDVFVVNAGKSGLDFDPPQTTAKVGDTIEFHFFAGLHDAVQGDFANPCQPPAAGGFSSGFVTVAGTGPESTTVFRVLVNDTNPIWFYCSQVQHCQTGMVGVINAPSGGAQTLAAYQAAAARTVKSLTPPSIQGGLLVPNGSPLGSSPASSASSQAIVGTTSSSTSASILPSSTASSAISTSGSSSATSTSATSSSSSSVAALTTQSSTSSRSSTSSTAAPASTSSSLATGAPTGFAGVDAALAAIIGAGATIFLLFSVTI